MLSSRRLLTIAAVAALAPALEACRRPEIRLPVPDTASGRAEPVDPGITTAQQLIEAMRDRYDGKWFNSLTFVQTSTYYRPDGSVHLTQTWPESVMIPGRLRIDIGNPSVGNAALYVNDTLYEFQQKRLVRRTPAHNPLQILGFDVYKLEPSRSLEILSAYGYDLSVMHRATHDGREYYVVGAPPGDLKRKQFWIEADRLLPWRFIEPWAPSDTASVREIRFQDYKQHGGGWVAEEVDFLKNGTRYFFEKYRDVRIDVEIDPALFDPRQFLTAKHWYREPAREGTTRP